MFENLDDDELLARVGWRPRHGYDRDAPPAYGASYESAVALVRQALGVGATITPPAAAGQTSGMLGPVVGVTDHHVVQRVARQAAVIHKTIGALADAGAIPRGPAISVTYGRGDDISTAVHLVDSEIEPGSLAAAAYQAALSIARQSLGPEVRVSDGQRAARLDHRGPIVGVTERYVVQRVAGNHAVIHRAEGPLADVNADPSRSVAISYNRETGDVTRVGVCIPARELRHGRAR